MVADYQYQQGAVITTASTLVTSGTGVLKDVAGGTAQQMYDMLGNPIASIPVNALGVFPSFRADIPRGVLGFGVVDLPVSSLEAADGADALVAAAAAALTAEGARLAAAESLLDLQDYIDTHPGGNVADIFASTAFTPALDAAVASSPTVAGKVAKGEVVLNVRDFGAVGNGTTNDTAAFSAAVAYANSLNATGIAANVVGVTIWLPNGRYRLAGAVTPILRAGVNFAGSSENGAVLLLEYNGATFTWGDASNLPVGGGMSNVKIEYAATPGASSVVFDLPQATRLRFSNLLLVNVAQLVNAGIAGGTGASALYLLEVRGYTYSSGRPVISLNQGAGLYLANCGMFVSGVVAPTVNRTSTMTTVAGTNLISSVGSWDTIQITGCFFERYYRGLYLAPDSGRVVNNIHLSNTYFDYHRESCIYIAPALGGIVAGLMINNSWFSAWEGDGISLNGAGVVRGVNVSNCVFPSAGTHSFKIGTGQDITIADCLMYGSNRTNVNAMGLAVFGGSHITIRGCRIGFDSSWAGFAWQPYAGIYVVANLDHHLITGNDLAGAAGGLVRDANAAGSKNRLVKDNIGTTYSGSTAFTLPASTVAWTNTEATTSTVSIHGGTVTVIAKNGTTITGMTSGSVTLFPGETLTVTYSVAPSVTRFVHA